MASKKRLLKSFFRLVLPLVTIIILATAGASVWLIYTASNAPKAAYLVTPDKYGLVSTRGAQVTDESWTNRDGTQSRGWLLRGQENAPAIILLHRYGTDRSWTLDLGVKISEATNFTVLMPDERGHGENPLVKRTSFGGCEADDVAAAMDFLRGLKSGNNPLVGKDFGVYGIELGALAGLKAAAQNESIKALVLDSVPASSDEMLASIVAKKFPFASALTSKLATQGTYLYFAGNSKCYDHDALCTAAKSLANRKILLLAGADAPDFQDSTRQLESCFPKSNDIESKLYLPISGYGLKNAPIAQSEIYERQVIDFFKKAFSGEN